jgi:hypothetical protein
MSNPHVRGDLHFYPEDSGEHLSEAWQAQRWLHQLDADLTTPMVRIHGNDYFIHEPAMKYSGEVVMINRWFTRDNKLFARTSPMRKHGVGWTVDSSVLAEGEATASDLLLNLPALIEGHERYQLPDPRQIIGMVVALSLT